MSDHEHFQNKTSISDFSKIIDDKYLIIGNIARGNSCKVKLVKSLHNGQFYACKIISQKTRNLSNALKNMEKEIEFYNRIKHEHSIKLIDHNLEGKKFSKKKTSRKCQYIILEHASKGDLFEYVSNNKGLYFKCVRYYMRQLINAVEGLHSNNICHRDVKLDNILLDENFRIKLSDFEFCQYIRDQNGDFICHTDKLGTVSYMAPEFFQLRKKGNEWKIFHHGDKVDIFSCGVLLFLLLTGSYPFYSAEKIDPEYKCFFNDTDKEIFWKKKANSNIPESARDLINRMLEPNPEKRITLKEIKEHAFYNEDISSDIEINAYMNNILKNIEVTRKSKM